MLPTSAPLASALPACARRFVSVITSLASRRFFNRAHPAPVARCGLLSTCLAVLFLVCSCAGLQADTWRVNGTIGTNLNLFDVWGTSRESVWAVGQSGTIRYWNGQSWAAQTSGTTQTFNAVWGTSPNEVWAAGTAGTIRYWDGSSWNTQTSNTTLGLQRLWGTSSSNVWAVGLGGTIRIWNGSSWTTNTSGTGSSLFGVWGTDANNVWVVGNSGLIRFWNGSTWTVQTSGVEGTSPPTHLYALWGTDANNVWAGGVGGVILKWNGTSWSQQTSGTTQEIRNFWGVNATNLWAVGRGGTILKGNGSSWTADTSGTTNGLVGVWGSGPSSVLSVGLVGTNLTNAPAVSSPVVDSPTSTGIGETSATLGGNVTDDGGAMITERGIVYSATATNSDPLISGTGVTKVTTTGTTGVFTLAVSGLSMSTGYSFKAYATNASGTSFSPVATFTTAAPASAPTVTTPTSTSLTATSATLGGNVTADGGAGITERGIVYSVTSTNADPLINGTGVTKVTTSGTTGSFTLSAGSLAPGTAYSFKAYATNSAGTGYSGVASFTTLAPEIAVEQPLNTDLTDGISTVSFGTETVGISGTPVTFTIRNSGTGTLTLGGITKDGAHPGNFAVSAPLSSTLEAGETTTFTVTFTPSATGIRTATINIANNDATENPFDLFLSGTGLAANSLPVITSNGGGATAVVNVPEGSVTVTTVIATDADVPATQTLSYSKSGADAGLFTLNTGTGQLVLNAGQDFETKADANDDGVYEVTVTVTDTGTPTPGTDSQALSVTVTNVNELPSFTKGADQSLVIGTSAAQSVSGWATALNDGDSTVTQALSFTITGNTNAGLFTTAPAISSNGTLTYTPSGTQGEATITVTMSDDTSIDGSALTTASQSFKISVISIYQQWANANTVSPTVTTDDDDTDGVINLLEFAFGTNPRLGSSGPSELNYSGTFAGGGSIAGTGKPKPVFESVTNGVDFRALFVRRKDYALAGLTYTVKFSADMSTWQSSTVTPTVLADDGTFQIVSVPYLTFVAGRKAKFFVVDVTLNP
jgi:hypothetical protein